MEQKVIIDGDIFIVNRTKEQIKFEIGQLQMAINSTFGLTVHTTANELTDIYTKIRKLREELKSLNNED